MFKKIKQFFVNIWNKICQFGRWLKSKTKQVLIMTGIIGVAVAAGITLQQPEKIPFVEIEGQVITFPYTDENNNENFIIRTDKEEYDNLFGKTNVDVYIMVENKSGIGQVTDIQFYFPKEAITVNSISKMIPNGTYQAIVEDFATSTAIDSTTSKEIVITKKISEHKEMRIGNIWQDDQITSFDKEDNKVLLSKGNLKEKSKPNQRADKKVQVPILNQGISYFKVNIKIPPLHREEFYIEVVGNEGGYGLLDPTLYEYYITNDDGGAGNWGTYQNAQTFTPSISHTPTSVKLKLGDKHGASNETTTASIKAVDSSGKATSTDLCSGVMYAGSITATTTGDWYEITLTSCPVLVASTQYAIVLKCPDATALTYFRWRNDVSSPAYTGGKMWQSADSGATWATDLGADAMFEEWGTPVAEGGVFKMEVIIID